jgi:hypothetical protein
LQGGGGRTLRAAAGPTGYETAIAFLEQAIAADPAFAEAHAELAGCVAGFFAYGFLGPDEAQHRAETTPTARSSSTTRWPAPTARWRMSTPT